METARNSLDAMALWDVNTASYDGSGLRSMTLCNHIKSITDSLHNVFPLQTEIKALGCPWLKEQLSWGNHSSLPQMHSYPLVTGACATLRN